MSAMKFINMLRCKLAYALAHSGHPKGLGLGLLLSPDTTSLIEHRPRRPPALRVPRRSHLIYHQQTVDAQAVANSLETLTPQLPPEDEVIFLDVGGTMDAGILSSFGPHEWKTYSCAHAALPEQQSYTFGMNLGVAMTKGEEFIVWRTDYVYPPDTMERYKTHMALADFACPYDVLVGNAECDSAFVREHRDKLKAYDEQFWERSSRRLSLYETQDPALFAMRRVVWDQIGGLNHELWGYGWQFAEFAARVRSYCPADRIVYFGGDCPLHQTHVGTLMNLAGESEKWRHAQAGIDRFTRFLGGAESYWLYRTKQNLPPSRPVL
jgi:hypothetical protein